MKIGMVFPGYGSQFVGMGKELYDESRVMQEYFEEASNCLNINFVKLCFAASDAELARMENAYTALFLVSSAIGSLLKKEVGITPHIVTGYNTGEYAAMHTAGCFSFPDGLYLLSKFYTFYQELLTTGEFAGIKIVGLSAQEVRDVCLQATTQEYMATIAAYDSPVRHTVMGHVRAITAIQERLAEVSKVEVDDEPVEAGLHSSIMDPVALQLKLYLEKVDFKTLEVPLITNADAKEVTDGSAVKTALIKQIHSPILWLTSMSRLIECDVIVEVGPGTSLTRLLQSYYPEKKCIAINKKSDIQDLTALMSTQSTEN